MNHDVPHTKMHSKCDALDYHPQTPRLLAVSTSNLTGSTWSGSVILISVSDSFSTKEKEPINLQTDAGNADVTFAGEKGEFVAAANDEGSVFLWRTTKPAVEGTDLALSEHDDIVSSVAAHQSRLLSGSWDNKVKLWDVSNSNSLATFESHIGAVETVHFVDESLFLSGSQDKTVRLWDQRQATVLSIVQRNSAVCSVTASHLDSNIFATGEEDGSACVFDRRNLEHPLFCYTAADGVRRVRFSPHKANHLAVGSDDTTLSVLDTSNHTTIYTFSGHKDYVRGVAWDPERADALVSGGWDNTLHFHTLAEI